MGKIVVLTGASGGIGAELLATLLHNNTVEHVFATSRSGAHSQHDKLTWLTLDYQRSSSIDHVAAQLIALAPRIDWLIGATGLLHDKRLQPEKSLGRLNAETLDAVYRVNAAGPLALLGACAPLLKSAQGPKVAMLSAQVGSIGDNHLGGWYSYRMAKAALNMGIRNAAIEAARWKTDASIIAIHPGTTLTELSRPFVTRRKKPVREPATTARLIIELMKAITPDQNGQFLTADGDPLPW